MNYRVVMAGDDICHHGIKGQKWGVRRYQNKDGSLTPAGEKRYADKNLKKAKTANLDKWGKTPNTNVCYVTGFSGSGKTTTANRLRGKDDIAIHLDSYSEGDTNGELVRLRDKTFNAFLDKAFPEWKKIPGSTRTGEKGTVKRFSNEYWDLVDKFRDSIETFGREEFKKGHKVVVEGVQIADDWLAPDKSYYQGKPTVALGTSALASMRRAIERDESFSVPFVKNYLKNSKVMNSKINNFANSTDAKKGSDWVKKFLKDSNLEELD